MAASSSQPEPDSAAAEPEDDELARRAQAGDDPAFAQLVRRHEPGVARLLWRFTRHASDLDDLVQDTFLRVVRHLPRWRPEQPFAHWLRRIAANVGRDYCRRSSVRSRWQTSPPPGSPDAIDPASDPAARAAATEAVALLAQLPPDDRLVLTLHHLEGWELAEIADSLGWTATATRLRAFRARRRLRALLGAADLP